MSGDVYRVEVIHYLNPHLIWVEVLDPSNAKDDYVFEQVGLYGVLPLEKTLDIEFEELKILKCDNWMPAATKILKDIFNNSTEVWFSPTYIDRRTSIFNDNIHRYGELLIKNEQDGKLKKVSKLLIKKNLAYYDLNEFHQKLSSGNLNTKLSSIKIEEVVKEIEKFYTKKFPKLKSEKEKAVKKQTSVFQTYQEFESLLTVSNVEKHNNEILHKLLKKKAWDFELCKEVDEESVGCGFKLRSDFKQNAYKQRQTASGSGSSNNYEKAFDDMKTFTTTNMRVKYDTKSQVSEQNDKQTALSAFLNKRIHIYNKMKQMNKSESDKKENIQNTSNASTEINETLKTKDEMTWKFMNNKKPSCCKYNKESLDKMENKISDEKNEVDGVILSCKEDEISKKSPNVCKPSKNMKEKKHMIQVAYGPPGLDKKKFKIDIKLLDPEEYYFENTKEEPKEMEFDRNNMFANSESHVDMDQTDKIMQNDYVTQINNGTDEKEKDTEVESSLNKATPKTCSTLQMKIKTLENLSKNTASSSSHTLNKKSTNSDSNDSDEDIDEIYKRINAKYKSNPTDNTEEKQKEVPTEEVLVKYNVNPFRNIDPDISVFVDKLVSPVLMVHLKINRRVQPVQNLRDVCFNKHIHGVLKNMSIKGPMMIQTVSWPIILRGYSLFMVSPPNSGKTMGYLPAVCRLVSDDEPSSTIDSSGPIAIIVCATAKLVANVERMAKIFLGLEDRVLACYPGVDDLYVTTALLNGCDLLIATPVYLSKLFQTSDYGVDLRRLLIFVLDDCERLFTMYENEIKTFQIKIKKMLKKRTQKELKVQYILASRVWCDNMEALALKAPDTVICISAFQECVLYSKTDMSVSFIKNDKLKYLFDFLQNIDRSKKTVIVCNSDDEVEMLEKALQSSQQIIYATNNKMSVHDLYDLSVSWSQCNVPLLGPILICCDGNLTHMNITDAHNLIHFSLPQLYSMFCKRFSVLNDNYQSIFKNKNDVVKIKVFVEDSNAEQLPKIINFIRRCTDVPDVLDGVCKDILKQKDVVKAENLVPLCDRLLMLGECPDIFYCHERHTILKDYDMPLEWLPTEGFVTFKVLHYSSATSYSGRILTNILDGNVVKYPQTYSTLSLKMGMYYCKEVNRKLHGYPKVGDICAVSIKMNLYARCQVVKILNTYERGNPNNVLIKLIDEEWYEVTRDINLYHLPEELKAIETRVAQIKLMNIAPKDNDITFSDLAKNHIKKIIESEEDLFLRGHIALTIGNCIFVDSLEVCQHLTSLNEVVVKHNIKHELLKNHAILNEDLLPSLKKMCIESGIPVTGKTANVTEENMHQETEIKKISESLERIANFEEKNIEEINDYIKKDQSRKFENEKLSVQDEYPDKEVSQNLSVTENTKLLSEDKVEKEVFISDSLERFSDFEEKTLEINDDAKIHRVGKIQIEKIDDNNREPVSQNSFNKAAKNQLKGKWACLESDDLNLVVIGSSNTPEQFFIRLQDFESSMKTLLDDIEKYVANVNSNEVILREGEIVLARFPDDSTYERARIDEINGDNVKCFFLDQGDWVDTPTNYLLPITEDFINQIPFQAIECKLLGVRAPNDKWTDSTNKWFYDYCYEDENGILKMLYAKYYTKETAEFTGGYKYGVVLFDSSGENDVLINQLMINLDLAKENADEVQYLKIDTLNATNVAMSNESCNELEIDEEIVDLPSSSQVLSQKLIRSVPLVNSDNSDDDDNKWDVNFNSGAMKDIASNILPQGSTLIDQIDKKNTVNTEISKSTDQYIKPVETKVMNNTSSLIMRQASNLLPSNQKPTESNPIRKPKLLWRQNKNTVSISIIIDVDKYHLEIEDRSLKFSTEFNNAKYEFDIELYGVIDKDKSSHVKKGMVISVVLEKYIKNKNWLALVSTRESSKHWISYDVSVLDTSSDEEEKGDTKDLENYIRRTREEHSESEDDEFKDDLQR